MEKFLGTLKKERKRGELKKKEQRRQGDLRNFNRETDDCGLTMKRKVKRNREIPLSTTLKHRKIDAPTGKDINTGGTIVMFHPTDRKLGNTDLCTRTHPRPPHTCVCVRTLSDIRTLPGRKSGLPRLRSLRRYRGGNNYKSWIDRGTKRVMEVVSRSETRRHSTFSDVSRPFPTSTGTH